MVMTKPAGQRAQNKCLWRIQSQMRELYKIFHPEDTDII